MCGSEEDELEETEEEEEGTVQRAIDLDRLIADWTADKKKEGRRTRFPVPHITINDTEGRRCRRTIEEGIWLSWGSDTSCLCYVTTLLLQLSALWPLSWVDAI